jgi:hypothetical protein
MTRLTLVVGQRRSALVAASLLILACDEDSATIRADAGSATDASVSLALDAAGGAGNTSQGPDATASADAGAQTRADAAADATPVSLRDAAAARDGGYGWADSAVLTGGGPPAPWAGKDIGMVARTGDTTATPTSFIVVAGGSDIGGGADSFHFVHQPLVGDGEIIARVAALGGAEPASKAGVMFRASLDPDAATVMLAVLGDGNTPGRLQARTLTGANTVVAATDAALKAGQFLRLVRAGRTFTAYRSANRATWTRVGSADADLPAAVYVGLATEAHSTSSTVQVTYNYATIDNLATDPGAAAWQQLDVGALGGRASFKDGALTLTGFGEPFTEAQDYFTGVAQVVSGSHRLTARVAAQVSTEPEARVGLMFREGLISTTSRMAPHALISFSPGKGVQFFSRGTQGGLTAGGARNMEAKTPVWLRLDKVEQGNQDQFTGWYSLDGASWTLLDSISLSAAQPLLMSLVSSSGSARIASTVRFDGIAATPLVADGGVTDTAVFPDASSTIDVVVDAGATDAAPSD